MKEIQPTHPVTCCLGVCPTEANRAIVGLISCKTVSPLA